MSPPGVTSSPPACAGTIPASMGQWSLYSAVLPSSQVVHHLLIRLTTHHVKGITTPGHMIRTRRQPPAASWSWYPANHRDNQPSASCTTTAIPSPIIWAEVRGELQLPEAQYQETNRHQSSIRARWRPPQFSWEADVSKCTSTPIMFNVSRCRGRKPPEGEGDAPNGAPFLLAPNGAMLRILQGTLKIHRASFDMVRAFTSAAAARHPAQGERPQRRLASSRGQPSALLQQLDWAASRPRATS